MEEGKAGVVGGERRAVRLEAFNVATFLTFEISGFFVNEAVDGHPGFGGDVDNVE